MQVEVRVAVIVPTIYWPGTVIAGCILEGSPGAGHFFEVPWQESWKPGQCHEVSVQIWEVTTSAHSLEARVAQQLAQI